jgi:aspartyl/asparaginyl beta-hydroxylase (cupin superfamily)
VRVPRAADLTLSAAIARAYNFRIGAGPRNVVTMRASGAVMGIFEQFDRKRARRITGLAIVLVPAFYFFPIITAIFVACGALDVSRHRRISYDLIEKYFMGRGIITWLLSPLNLLADLFSYPNKGQYALADLPAEHRAEIETCVRAFVGNAEMIKAHIAKTIGGNKRSMLTFKWYEAEQATDLKIAAFAENYRYIKTIAVSVFNTRERTSWHFGPLRLTFRVLYNLEPIDSRDVFIEVDDKIHYWRDEPLFIFDDTMFHRSINDVDHIRYCLFMDIVRPNYAQSAFEVAVQAASIIAGSFKRLFYRHWSFVR